MMTGSVRGSRHLVLLGLVAPLLAGCVAPEPPPVVRRPATPVVQGPPRTDLQPAPLANRALKAPTGAPILQVDGLTKAKKPPAESP